MQRFQTQKIQNALNIALNTLLPPRCVITGDFVEHQGMLSGAAWAGLSFIADPMCKLCGVPFAFDSEMAERGNDTLCIECLQNPPPFQRHRSALLYNETSRDLILSYKHGDQTHLVRTFIPIMQKSGADILKQADIIIPVPLHRWRLLKRRYNQAGLLSTGLSKVTGTPCIIDGLTRTRATISQGHMKRDERTKNVRRAFCVSSRHEHAIKDKNIILIDDVYTTGATINECAKTLKKAGAKTVSALTIARVMRDM